MRTEAPRLSFLSIFPGRRAGILGAAFAALAVPAATGRAESLAPEIRFERQGARYQGFFDADSTGTVTVTVPPGLTATTEALVLIHAPIASGDLTTTGAVYDPGTASTFSLSVAEVPPGPHSLTVRLPGSGLRAWTQFSRRDPAGQLPSSGETTSEALAAEYREMVLRRLTPLFDEETSGVWLGSDPDTDSHFLREDVYHAIALLARGGVADVARANTTLSAFCAAQERESSLPWEFGQFYENGSDRRIPLTTVTFFGTPVLARLALEPPPGLLPSTREQIVEAVGHAARFFDWRFSAGLSPDATNYHLLGTAALALAGRLLDEPAYVARARQAMQLFYDHVLPEGAPYEYNSPVYLGVSQWALSLILEQSDDPQLLAQARVLYERFWLDAALTSHAELRHFSGPYSRAYEDVVHGGTSLGGFLLSAEIGRGGYSGAGRLAENFDALHSHDVNPACFLTTLHSYMSPELKSVFRSRRLPADSRQRTKMGDMASHLSRSFTLGTSSWLSHVQGEGFLLQVAEPEAPGGFAPLFVRSGASGAETVDYRFSSGVNTLALQDGPRALVMVARPVAAAESPARRALFALVADERFARWEDLRINGIPVPGTGSFGLNDTLFLRRADVYLAVRPLYASAVGPRTRIGSISRSSGYLNIALHAADASEPLALAGQQLEAGFAVAVAEQADWLSYESFIADVLASSHVQTEEAATTRSVAWNWHGTLECEVERATGRFLSRSVGGAPLPDLMAEAEFVRQTAGTSLTLRDLQIDGLAPYSWAVYPEGSETALVVNPAAAPATLTTNWSASPVEIPAYGLLRLTRPVPSRVEQWKLY